MLFQEGVEEFLLDCRVRNLSKRTIETYRSQIRVFSSYIFSEFELDKLEEIKKPHVKSFILWMKEERSANYINQILKALRTFYKYLFTEEYIDRNFMLDIQYLKSEKRLINTFNDQEVAAMIGFYDHSGFVNQRNRLIIEIMADCGLRAEEVRCLSNDNFKGTFFQLMGKGHKERVVPISQYLQLSIKKYQKTKRGYFNNLRNYHEIDNYIVVNKSGKKITNNVLLEKIVKDAANGIGVRDEVKRRSCHSLRHYYAQKLLKSGVNLYTISRLLGHSNIKTTQTYLNSLSDADILENTKVTPLERLLREGKM